MGADAFIIILIASITFFVVTTIIGVVAVAYGWESGRSTVLPIMAVTWFVCIVIVAAVMLAVVISASGFISWTASCIIAGALALCVIGATVSHL